MVLNRQRDVAVSLPPLNAFVARVCTATGLKEDAFSVCLVSDAAMARLNRTYRGKSGPTDVLSFPASPRRAIRGRSSSLRKPLPGDGFLGDVAISPRTARRNARRFGRRLTGELQILILHGVLHLLGYDHETDNGTMTRVETRLRSRLRIG